MKVQRKTLRKKLVQQDIAARGTWVWLLGVSSWNVSAYEDKQVVPSPSSVDGVMLLNMNGAILYSWIQLDRPHPPIVYLLKAR